MELIERQEAILSALPETPAEIDAVNAERKKHQDRLANILASSTSDVAEIDTAFETLKCERSREGDEYVARCAHAEDATQTAITDRMYRATLPLHLDRRVTYFSWSAASRAFTLRFVDAPLPVAPRSYPSFALPTVPTPEELRRAKTGASLTLRGRALRNQEKLTARANVVELVREARQVKEDAFQRGMVHNLALSSHLRVEDVVYDVALFGNILLVDSFEFAQRADGGVEGTCTPLAGRESVVMERSRKVRDANMSVDDVPDGKRFVFTIKPCEVDDVRATCWEH